MTMYYRWLIPVGVLVLVGVFLVLLGYVGIVIACGVGFVTGYVTRWRRA